MLVRASRPSVALYVLAMGLAILTPHVAAVLYLVIAFAGGGARPERTALTRTPAVVCCDHRAVNMSAIRLVLSDVDGTLVTSDKRLTDATVDAVARLRKAGIAFAVTSGRPPRAGWRCS